MLCRSCLRRSLSSLLLNISVMFPHASPVLADFFFSEGGVECVPPFQGGPQGVGELESPQDAILRFSFSRY
jgi:hypothetical protein